jgi:uncharacterized protein
MYNRLFNLDNNSNESFFIFGPRGVGKTSWLIKNFPKAIRFDLLKDSTYTKLLGNPSSLEDYIPSDYKDWIIIDEIQKIPALLDEAHRLIEERKLKFILTGSSARKLRRSGVNLLAGRALIKNMFPITALEQGKDFNLIRSLKYGNLPMAISSKNPGDFLKSYIATYLREEVLQESLTRNIALFTKFLEMASFSQGEMINYTKIAQEIGSKRHTVENFFEILEDLLIASRLPVFTKRAKRDTVKTPKFYYFDVGVYRSIRPTGPLDLPEEIDGAALETLFLQEAKAINNYFKFEYEFYFWRTHTKLEVDFILYGEKGLLAFEIKRKGRLKSDDFKGLKAFKKDYPICTAIMIYGGSDKYIHQDIQVIPINDALKNMKDILK